MVRLLYKDLCLLVLFVAAILNGCGVDIEKEMAATEARKKAASSSAKQASLKVDSSKIDSPKVEVPSVDTSKVDSVKVDSVKVEGNGQVFEEATPVDSGNVHVEVTLFHDSSYQDSGKTLGSVCEILKGKTSKLNDLYNSYSKLDYWPGGTYRFHGAFTEDSSFRIISIMDDNSAPDGLVDDVAKILNENFEFSSGIKYSLSVKVGFRRDDVDLVNLGSLIGSVDVSSEKEEVKSAGEVNFVYKKDITVKPGSSLGVESVQYGVRRRYSELRHVYNKHLQGNPDFTGTVVLALSILPNGSVSDVSVESSSTNEKEFDKELVETVARWKFDKSKGTSKVTIPFTFSQENYSAEKVGEVVADSGEKIAQVEEKVEAKNKERKIKGLVNVPRKSDMSFSSAVSSSVVVRTIRAKTPGLRPIYVKSLKSNPDGFEGTVALTLTVEPDGTISDIYIKFSTTNFEEFDERIKIVVSQWKFDFKNKAANEKVPDSSVTVTVPFDFYMNVSEG